jgi:hypothetical protein
MAITFKLDDRQHTEIVRTIKEGFDGLVGALTGTTEAEQQAFINQLAANLKLSTDEVEAAIKQSQPKEG